MLGAIGKLQLTLCVLITVISSAVDVDELNCRSMDFVGSAARTGVKLNCFNDLFLN